uniref:Uncharacterized protein n=1 Tax=Serinus canaria TaxID=9135 RepID=A0A8C9MNL6_SERCA
MAKATEGFCKYMATEDDMPQVQQLCTCWVSSSATMGGKGNLKGSLGPSDEGKSRSQGGLHLSQQRQKAAFLKTVSRVNVYSNILFHKEGVK